MSKSIFGSLLWTVTLLGLLSAGTTLAEDAKPAGGEEKITYEDHVRPILREHCFSCHNQGEAKSGLALDSYSKLREGGSSGEVVIDGDPDSSRLWALVSHTEEPFMPPMQDKLSQDKLDVLRKWIENGALENAGSTAAKKKKTSFEMTAPVTRGKPEGPAAMPEGLLKQPAVYTPRAGAITALATSPWAPLAAVAGQEQVVLYHTDTGECLGVLPFPEGIPYVLKFSRNGEVLLVGGGRGGHSGCVVLFDVRTGKRLTKVGDELDAVLAADINDTHTRVALGGPQRIVRIYSTETGELVHEIKKHTDWIFAIDYSPDGVLLATADRSNGLFVWEAETAREYLNLQGHTGPIWDLSWRDDSNLLASASEDGTVRWWEMLEGKQIKSWGAHGNGTLSVHFAHDGRLTTAGRDNLAKFWDANGGEQKAFSPFAEPVLCAAVTHDVKRIVTGDWSGQVQVWDVESGQAVATLLANPPTLEMVVESRSAEVSQAQAALAKAEMDWKAAEQRLQELTAAMTEAQKQVETAASVAAQSQQELEAARAALEAANQAVTQTSETLAKAQAEQQPAEAIAAATQAAEEAKAKQAQADSEVKRLEQAAQTAAQQAEAAKKAAEQKAAERAEAENQAAPLRMAHEQAKAAAEAAQQKLAAAQADLAAFQQAEQKLQEQMQQAVQQAATAEQQIAGFQEAQQTLTAELEKAKAESEQMAERLAALKAEYEKLVAHQQQVEQQLQAKTGEMQQVQDLIEASREAAQEAEAALNFFRDVYGKK